MICECVPMPQTDARVTWRHRLATELDTKTPPEGSVNRRPVGPHRTNHLQRRGSFERGTASSWGVQRGIDPVPSEGERTDDAQGCRPCDAANHRSGTTREHRT